MLARTSDKIHESFTSISNINTCESEFGEEDEEDVNA